METVSIRERPGRPLLEAIRKCFSDLGAAVVDVPKELRFREDSVGMGVGVFVEGFRGRPGFELGRQVVVESEQRMVREEPGG